jgi:hypothetical protein
LRNTQHPIQQYTNPHHTCRHCTPSSGKYLVHSTQRAHTWMSRNYVTLVSAAAADANAALPGWLNLTARLGFPPKKPLTKVKYACAHSLRLQLAPVLELVLIFVAPVKVLVPAARCLLPPGLLCG